MTSPLSPHSSLSATFHPPFSFPTSLSFPAPSPLSSAYLKLHLEVSPGYFNNPRLPEVSSHIHIEASSAQSKVFALSHHKHMILHGYREEEGEGKGGEGEGKGRGREIEGRGGEGEGRRDFKAFASAITSKHISTWTVPL